VGKPIYGGNKSMISKERFVKALRFIQKMAKLENDINSLYKENELDFTSFSYSEYEGELIETLMNVMQDEDELICWWIYQVDFGQELDDDENSAEDKDGNKIDIKTAEKLYDYLVKRLDK
jgi:hypothetical protein